MKKHILLMAESGGELQPLGDVLRRRRPDWTVEFVGIEPGTEPSLPEGRWDAFVSDNVSVLETALRLRPESPRVLLVDLGTPELVFRQIGGVHQFLIRPCEPDRLEVVLARVFSLLIWLPSQAVWPLLGRMPRIPSPGPVYDDVIRELQQPHEDTVSVTRWITDDPPMCAKILQLANSAAYGPPLDECSPAAAVEALGPANVRSALLLGHSYADMRELKRHGFLADEQWRHARRVRDFAEHICVCEDTSSRLKEMAAVAGLLHDLGKLALAANLPEVFRESRKLVRQEHLDDWEAEQRVFETSHDEVAACLLALWNLPMPVIEAVGMHHRPTRLYSDQFSPLTVVHVANAFAHSASLDEAKERLDLTYLAELRLGERLPLWWRHCNPSSDSPFPASTTSTGKEKKSEGSPSESSSQH